MKILFHIRVAIIGFIMGAADLVPGVSGGTIAFVSGIYDRLLNGIKSFDLTTLQLLLRGQFRAVWARVPVTFFIALGFGLITAILSLSHVLAGLFKSHPVQLWSFFFGLVLGSILLLIKETWRWRLVDIVSFAVAAFATYQLVGMQAFHTPESPFFLFLAGAIAICAMILPGISGSYLLVIMGKYQQVLEAVNNRDFISLAIFISGIVVGILSFVRIVSWLLNRWRHATLVALTGIMAGALRTVWPWKEILTTRINSKGEEVPLSHINILPTSSDGLLLALALVLLGAIVVFGISRLSPDHRHNTQD
jgi:putative membrane protein